MIFSSYSRDKFAKWRNKLVFVFFTIFALFSLFYFYQNKEQNISDVNIETWQIYKNKDFGFEFQYPKDFLIEKPIDGSNILLYGGRNGINQFKIELEKNSFDPKTEKSQISSSLIDEKNIYEKEINKIKLYFYVDQAESGKDFVYILPIINNRSFLKIIFSEDIPLIEQEKILSTFKFFALPTKPQ